jgi:hypothetical protein
VGLFPPAIPDFPLPAAFLQLVWEYMGHHNLDIAGVVLKAFM